MSVQVDAAKWGCLPITGKVLKAIVQEQRIDRLHLWIDGETEDINLLGQDKLGDWYGLASARRDLRFFRRLDTAWRFIQELKPGLATSIGDHYMPPGDIICRWKREDE